MVLRRTLSQFQLGVVIFGESWSNSGPHRVAPFAFSSPHEITNAQCSPLHLSKHLARAIHKQTCPYSLFYHKTPFFLPFRASQYCMLCVPAPSAFVCARKFIHFAAMCS